MNPTAKQIRFLLVEDDDAHAYLVQRNLERHGICRCVTRVADGAEALAYLRREGAYHDCHRPDVVLLDLKLPKVDGIQVLEQIKADAELRAIPVVMLTTSDEENDRMMAYTHRANSYIVKPLESAEFTKMLEDLGTYWSLWNVRPK